MKPESLKTLVKRAQHGDADAFGNLYDWLKQDLFRFAFYLTSSPQLAEDAVSDCVLLAFPQESDLALHASLHAALQKLPQDERELLLLSVLFGYSSRELAAMLETKEGTIRARLSRTKAKLRETLGEGEDEA